MTWEDPAYPESSPPPSAEELASLDQVISIRELMDICKGTKNMAKTRVITPSATADRILALARQRSRDP